MFIDDLVSVFVNAGVAVYGTNLFSGSKSQIPAGDGPFMVVKETGGSKPAGTHNARAFGLPGYQQPSAQIFVCAATPVAALTMILAAYAAIVSVGQTSQFVNGVWWVLAFPIQEPADFGLDDLERSCYVFNVSVKRRPNAAMSQ